MSWRDLAGIEMPEGVDDDLEFEDKAHNVSVVALEGPGDEEEEDLDPDVPQDLHAVMQQIANRQQKSLTQSADGVSSSNATGDSQQQQQQQPAIKRVKRSRWGGGDESNSAEQSSTLQASPANTNVAGLTVALPTSASAGVGGIDVSTALSPANAAESQNQQPHSGDGGTARRRNRWSSATEDSAVAQPAAAPSITPAGMPPTGTISTGEPTNPNLDPITLAALERVKNLASTLSLTTRIHSAPNAPSQPANSVASSILGGNLDPSHPEYNRFMELRRRVELYQTKLNNVAYWLAQIPPEERSPSPDAIYDNEGRRVNTRERRFKDKLIKERNAIIEQAQEIDPTFSVVGYKKERPFVKIPIPVDEYPDYNFSGTIIGPRGHTQKRLEQETGCKISVRGKNANKDKSRRKPQADDNEPMHVFIQGPTMEHVEKAAAIIRDLLIVRPEEENEHKSRQLRELAALNGFVRDESRRMQAAANRSQPVVARVVCGLCGSTSHATMDCKRKQEGITEADFEAEVDRELEKFISTLRDDGQDFGSGPSTAESQQRPDNVPDRPSSQPIAQPASMPPAGGPPAPQNPPGSSVPPPVTPMPPYGAGALGSAYPPMSGPYPAYPGYGAPPPAAYPGPWHPPAAPGYPPAPWPPGSMYHGYGYPPQGYPSHYPPQVHGTGAPSGYMAGGYAPVPGQPPAPVPPYGVPPPGPTAGANKGPSGAAGFVPPPPPAIFPQQMTQGMSPSPQQQQPQTAAPAQASTAAANVQDDDMEM